MERVYNERGIRLRRRAANVHFRFLCDEASSEGTLPCLGNQHRAAEVLVLHVGVYIWVDFGPTRCRGWLPARAINPTGRTANAVTNSSKLGFSCHPPLTGASSLQWLECNLLSAGRFFGLQFLVDFLGAVEGGLYILADVLAPNQFLEFFLMYEPGRLFANAAQDQRTLRGMQLFGQFFQREQAGGIESGHIS